MNYFRTILYCFFIFFFLNGAMAQSPEKLTVVFDENHTYQTIQNFAASDAWSCQFIGNWPDAKRNAIADWLFSMDTLSNGNPKGIGLSMWRYNLGAGSAEQGDSSGIKDEWRRAASTLTNNANVAAQNWFLTAAKKRGVEQYLGFFNSPPVQFTNNRKAWADSGRCNIDRGQYNAFADYTVNAIRQIKQSTGISLDYISPVNEPQWNWSDGGQEGCPYNNTEISDLVKAFDALFRSKELNTKLLITESGQMNYLLHTKDKPDKDEQIHDFFNSTSPLYIGNLAAVAHTIATHSYFTTSPLSKAIALRSKISESVAQVKGLGLWQSEYCILGDNEGEINGNKKDLGMDAALYVAKVMYEDLAFANVSAWQWWTALSAYDYKDGLVYIEKKKNDGNFSDSKMLWAMGNYSRFIRPGMQRIGIKAPAAKGIYLSAYKDNKTKEMVCVLLNETDQNQAISFDGITKPGAFKNIILYTTDATKNLSKQESTVSDMILPAKSVVTIVIK